MTPHFYTSSLQSTINYYTQVLCFELVLPPGDLSDHSCMLQHGDDAIIFEESSAPLNHTSWGKLNLFTDRLEQIFKNVADFADVKTNPTDTEAGTREFSVTDCNGIELVFSQVIPVDHVEETKSHYQFDLQK